MFCKNCGTKLGENDVFCTNCGTKKEEVIVSNVVNNNVVKKEDEKDFYTDEEEELLEEEPVNNSVVNNTNSVNTNTSTVTNTNTNTNNVNKGQTGEKKKSNVGLIIGIVLVVVFIVFLFFALLIGSLVKKVIDSGIIDDPNPIVEKATNTFNGDGYTLKYDNSWVKKTGKTVNGKEIYYLENSSYGITFNAIGRSSFTSNGVVDNFDSYSNRSKLYDAFSDFWNGEIASTSEKIVTGSFSFLELKDDMYYAYMDHGTSYSDITGRYYLVVSEKYNSICSFALAGDSIYLGHDKVVNILKTIEFSNTLMDDENGIFDSMSNWNMYKEVRSGALGKKKVLDGSWRKLSSNEDLWEFKNGKFHWYKDYSNLNDNYWEGTYTVVNGKDGLKSFGLDENKVESITASSSGNISSKDIYAVTLKPTKIISGGEDKSSTNISGEDWKYVWILIDHGSEGIEAQTLNVNTYETHYLVKVKD